MNFGDLPPQQPRKSKFKPKPPTRRLRVPKRETVSEGGRAGLEILQRFQEIGKNRKLEGAKDSSSASNSYQAAPSVKPYETGTTEYSGNKSSYASSSRDGEQKVHCLPSPDMSADAIVSTNFDAAVAKKKIKKDYIEPWDYDGHFPTTLPLRRPFSGRPEILDELEFGENQSMEPDESSTTHATQLGLHEICENPELFLVQLPDLPLPRLRYRAQRPDTGGSSMPMVKADPSTKGKEIVTSRPASGQVSAPRNIATVPRPVRVPVERNPLEGIPGGQVARMLVYNSGKVKLKIGETMFDVAPGIHSENMAQYLGGINTKENAYWEVGKLDRKMTVTPDIDFLLDLHLDSK